MKQGLNMKFTDTRNEISRAQTHINQTKMVHEALDGARIANPMWRSVNKMNWVDSKKPFRVVKADVKLISDRNPSQADSNRKMS